MYVNERMKNRVVKPNKMPQKCWKVLEGIFEICGGQREVGEEIVRRKQGLLTTFISRCCSKDLLLFYIHKRRYSILHNFNEIKVVEND
jgi:hypothetical protein